MTAISPSMTLAGLSEEGGASAGSEHGTRDNHIPEARRWIPRHVGNQRGQAPHHPDDG